MAKIGFHASHELFAPSDLLRFVRRAEQAGFPAAMCSDHFFPWTTNQGQSGYTWSWLGAALQATQLPFGTVCAPGQRYHPAIIAQASATLAEMFPGRLWVAFGSGQALNEHITGDPWPDKPTRNARLKEAVDVIRALWAGETVNRDGLIRVRDAKLYSRPAQPPLLVGAAITAETAEWCGGWADALITVGKEPAELRQVVEAFYRGGGEGKPLFLQAAIAYADSEEQALQNARDLWPIGALDIPVVENTPTPWEFDALTRDVRKADLKGKMRISADVQRHLDWLHGDVAVGFSEIYLHYIGRDVERFIDVFAERVLPAFRADEVRPAL